MYDTTPAVPIFFAVRRWKERSIQSGWTVSRPEMTTADHPIGKSVLSPSRLVFTMWTRTASTRIYIGWTCKNE